MEQGSAMFRIQKLAGAPRIDMENGRGTVICLVVATRCRTRCEFWRGAGRSGSSARCLPASSGPKGAGERSGNSSRASSIASVHTTAPFGSAVVDQTLSLARIMEARIN
jgi:hypothetical protein